MKNTIVINLFGAPGVGKSTGAAYIFAKLKLLGIDCELVTEFAKDKVWEENKAVFDCQFYIAGKQMFRLKRCYGKVDVIVTDSPILLSCIYLPDNPYYKDAVLYEFNKYNNYNILLNRVKEYNPNGRNQTEDEAKELDSDVKKLLNDTHTHYYEMDGTEDGYNKVIEKLVNTILPARHLINNLLSEETPDDKA